MGSHGRVLVAVNLLLALFVILAPKGSLASIKYLKGPFPKTTSDRVSVCSFNIQWLGHYKNKNHKKLASVVKNCDAVAVQELVAPPWDVQVEGRKLKKDTEAADFVKAMKNVGLAGVMLAPEDTGPNVNQSNGTVSEWPILFYNKEVLRPSRTLPGGYLAEKLAQHPVFSRVPYAFGLETLNGDMDFVLISVHLFPKSRLGDLYSKAQRIAEFQLIAEWINWQVDNHRSDERDYFVVGDMNVEDLEEYQGYLGEASTDLYPHVRRVFANQSEVLGSFRDLTFKSLNYAKNGHKERLYETNISLSKPYDHIMFDRDEISVKLSTTMEIVDLASLYSLKSHPTTRSFIQEFTDHNPIRMQIHRDSDRD